MSDTQEITQTKQYIAKLFGRTAQTYDQVGPKFFAYFGRRLVELARVTVGANILDIATGRGAVLFPVAKAVGPHGHVIGIDISEEMVLETSKEIKQLGLTNAEVHQMDAEQLELPDGSFDNVFCGLSIFMFPQYARVLSEIRRVLKPGGVVGLTTFWRDDMRWKWLGELFEKYLPPPPKEDQNSDDASESEESSSPDFRSYDGMQVVMENAGFKDVSVLGEEPDFVYLDEEDWWSTVWSHGMRGTLERIQRTSGAEALQQFKDEAFEKIQTVKQPDGFHHMWSVLYTLASKP